MQKQISNICKLFLFFSIATIFSTPGYSKKIPFELKDVITNISETPRTDQTCLSRLTSGTIGNIRGLLREGLPILNEGLPREKQVNPRVAHSDVIPFYQPIPGEVKKTIGFHCTMNAGVNRQDPLFKSFVNEMGKLFWPYAKDVGLYTRYIAIGLDIKFAPDAVLQRAGKSNLQAYRQSVRQRFNQYFSEGGRPHISIIHVSAFPDVKISARKNQFVKLDNSQIEKNDFLKKHYLAALLNDKKVRSALLQFQSAEAIEVFIDILFKRLTKTARPVIFSPKIVNPLLTPEQKVIVMNATKSYLISRENIQPMQQFLRNQKDVIMNRIRRILSSEWRNTDAFKEALRGMTLEYGNHLKREAARMAIRQKISPGANVRVRGLIPTERDLLEKYVFNALRAGLTDTLEQFAAQYLPAGVSKSQAEDILMQTQRQAIIKAVEAVQNRGGDTRPLRKSELTKELRDQINRLRFQFVDNMNREFLLGSYLSSDSVARFIAYAQGWLARGAGSFKMGFSPYICRPAKDDDETYTIKLS